MEYLASLTSRSFARRLKLRGYSLVELMVVIAIIGIILSSVLISQSQFDNALPLTNTAYSLALSIRNAQSYGLSSLQASTFRGVAYGIHFAGANTYTLFNDVSPGVPGDQRGGYCPGHLISDTTNPEAHPGDCIYQPNETVQTYNLLQNFRLGYCGTGASGTACSANGGLTGLDITFLRPNTTTVILGIQGGSIIPLTSATIYLYSPRGGKMCIAISQVGEVAVQQCP